MTTLSRSCSLALAVLVLTACACTTVVSVGVPDDAGPSPLDDAGPLPIADDAASSPDAAIPVIRPTPEISLEEPEWVADPGVTDASVAWNGEIYLVAFQTDVPTRSSHGSEVRAARFDAEGNLLDTRGILVGFGVNPRLVALPDGKFLYVWGNGAGILYYVVINQAGDVTPRSDLAISLAMDILGRGENIWIAVGDATAWTDSYRILEYRYDADSQTLHAQGQRRTNIERPRDYAQIRLALEGDQPAAYMTQFRDEIWTIVEWRDYTERMIATVGSIDGPPFLGHAVVGAGTTLITWRQSQRSYALRIRHNTGELIDAEPVELNGFRAEMGEVAWFPPLGLVITNGFGILSYTPDRLSSHTLARLARLVDEDTAPSFMDMSPPLEPGTNIRSVAGSASNRLFVVGSQCTLGSTSCVLAPMIWDLETRRIRTLESPRGPTVGTKAVQLACGRDVCAVAWRNDRSDGQISTRAFDRVTGELRTSARPLPDAREFQLTSDGENFLLITQRLDSSVAAHHAGSDLDWSEPLYAAGEIAAVDHPIRCAFDGTRFVALYEDVNGLRELTFSRDGSFLTARTVVTTQDITTQDQDMVLQDVVSNGVGYLAHLIVRTGPTDYGRWNGDAVACHVDQDGNVRTEPVSDIFVDWRTYEPGEPSLLAAMRNGPYAFVTRATEFAHLPVERGTIRVPSMWIETWSSFARNSAFADARSWIQPSLFGDEDGFVAVFRPAFNGYAGASADQFVVRRIDRMGVLVGDEMPLYGIAQIEAVASAGRSEMAIVYRADLDPLVPGNQLSELRARIVTVPSVPID